MADANRSLSLIPKDPELVIGLVGPLGADLRNVERELAKALEGVGYIPMQIDILTIAQRLPNLEVSTPSSSDPSSVLSSYKMAVGTEIRRRTAMPDALALLGITAIRALRDQKRPSSDTTGPLPRHAYLLHQLKRPEEVESLRRVYGDGFLLVGVYSSRQRRIENLARGFYRGDRVGGANLEAAKLKATELVNTDELESSNKKYGQAVRKTFEMSDVFLNADVSIEELKASVARVIHLLFWDPAVTPTQDEYAMFLAQGAALRSADLGRQVGAAITSASGQILSLGTNEVAKPGGGMYWFGDEPDQRDICYQNRFDTNTDEKLRILGEVLTTIKSAGWLAEGKDPKDSSALVELARGELKDSRLMSLIEFLRPVHGEMAALMDAARVGIAVGGGTLYVTAFPCHECAKHIVAAGIRRVVFIEPYPKSQVAFLFTDSIRMDGQCADARVPFDQFCGIAPRRYQALFSMADKLFERNPDESFTVLCEGRRDGQGQILDWERIKTKLSPKLTSYQQTYLGYEQIMVILLNSELQKAGLALSPTPSTHDQ